MKHPVTTTLTVEELEKLKNAKGSTSMLKFTHDAVMEKCERCKNERKNESRPNLGTVEQPKNPKNQLRERNSRDSDGFEDSVNDSVNDQAASP